MRTPTGEYSNDPQDPESIAERARAVSDLDRLEAMLSRREIASPPSRLPPAAQLGPVSGLASVDGKSDGRDLSMLPLPPEYLLPPDAIVLGRDRLRWPFVMLIAGACALPVAYFVAVGAGRPQQPSAAPQLASVETKPVAASALPQKRSVIRAQDDDPDIELSAARTKGARGEKLPEREIVAMLQPEDPGIRALSPSRPIRTLDPDEISLLTRQGEQFAEAGDFVSARALFQRAAEANDATAATALGTTYDPTVLTRLQAVGVDADVVKARFWYQKAVSLGSTDAKRRLDLLGVR
jgi:Flp pilus assembly protein TadD